MIHLPVVRTGPSLLVASFKPRHLPLLLPQKAGEGAEEDFQVKVGALVRTKRGDSILEACNPEPLM